MAKGQGRATEGLRGSDGACCCAGPPVAMSAAGKRVNVGMHKDWGGAVGTASLRLAAPLLQLRLASQNQTVVLMLCFQFAQGLFVVAAVLLDCRKCSS